MSSNTNSNFRPRYVAPRWRNDDWTKERERKAAEEAERKKLEKNENNFPSLSAAPKVHRMAPEGFAKLAEKWAHDDEVDRKVEEYKKSRAAADAISDSRIVALHRRRAQMYEEREEFVYEDEPEETPTAPPTEDDGWVEVKRKTRKPKRELTIAEMEARDRLMDQMNEQHDGEFNGELFESNRHDHDRV